MPCDKPLTAYFAAEVNPATGKRSLVFNSKASHSGVPLRVKCGQCSGCRLEVSRQWAMRCVHENQMCDGESAFVTLTYDSKFLPKYGSLDKRALSLFAKRLHNRLLRQRGEGIRWYGCGEYGEDNGRPHYHALIFKWSFPDRKFWTTTKTGEKLYTSKMLEELWPFGHCPLGDVTFESAAYVARYVMKKITGDLAAAHYERLDPASGELVQLTPEFTNMSRRPGIGATWIAKYGEQTMRFDSVVMRGKEMPPPRFYDSRLATIDAAKLERIKLKRRRKAMKHRKDNTSERRYVRTAVLDAKLGLYKRKLT